VSRCARATQRRIERRASHPTVMLYEFRALYTLISGMGLHLWDCSLVSARACGTGMRLSARVSRSIPFTRVDSRSPRIDLASTCSRGMALSLSRHPSRGVVVPRGNKSRPAPLATPRSRVGSVFAGWITLELSRHRGRTESD